MKKEYDFSKGERGKFYHSDAEPQHPHLPGAGCRQGIPQLRGGESALDFYCEYPRKRPATGQGPPVDGHPVPAADHTSALSRRPRGGKVAPYRYLRATRSNSKRRLFMTGVTMT